MKKIIFLVLYVFLCSCDKDYNIISKNKLEKFIIQDTLLKKKQFVVLKVGEYLDDLNSKLVVKKNNLYLFGNDSRLMNDSLIYSYSSPFLIDKNGEFRKNGIWVYAKFYKEGSFPFYKKIIDYNVDSIPENWNKKKPFREGIYFFENDSLILFSQEQSEEKFKEKEKTGFYFIPNTGRLFNKTNINDLN